MSYEIYFKDVSGYDVIDVYRAHRIFGLTDEVLCHASKKLLLSGVRTGGKTLEQDVREARDSLNRWLEMLQEDLGNAQEEDGWTPQEIEAAAFDTGITVSAAFKDACDCAEVEWPDESRIDVIGQNGNDGAVYSEYTLAEVTKGVEISPLANFVSIDKEGSVYESIYRPGRAESGALAFRSDWRRINKVVPPINYHNCIWEIER